MIEYSDGQAPLSLHQRDWSLHRKGPIDAARHQEKVREAIRGNIADIVSREDIIMSNGQDKIRVPIYNLNLPRLRYNPNNQPHAGQGDGNSKVGDVIGQEDGQGKGQGKGKQAGQGAGEDWYDAEISIDELAEVLFEELRLPNLKPRRRLDVTDDIEKWNDIRKKGPMSNLDKRRTILENIKRNAMAGNARFEGIKNEDLRFRTWNTEQKPTNSAVVIAMRDVSGSMGEFEKFITRSFYFWMVRFLRTNYQNVGIRFITHHEEAKEVDEKTFFTLGESGGTRVSSAYKLALDMVEHDYPGGMTNVFLYHFTDGDNWGDTDNRLCREFVERILSLDVNQFGYGQILENSYIKSTKLQDALEQIKDDRFVSVNIRNRTDVFPALRKFFAKNPAGLLLPV